MQDATEGKGGVDGVLVASLSAWSAVGAIGVYLIGYLALRFRLTALGVGTDLHLVDERYLFEGARCLVFLVSSAPVALVLALPLLLLVWLGARVAGPRLRGWWGAATGPLLLGVAVSLAMIQIVMRKCFLFDNLLLRADLPEPAWFAALLRAPGDLAGQVYFTVLFVGIAAPIGLSRSLRGGVAVRRSQRALAGLLFLLIVVQVLLLPVNYGVLMSFRGLARVSPPPGVIDVAGDDAAAWLIWEGGGGLTFFVRDGGGDRSLVTQAREQLPVVQILGYDGFADVRGVAPRPPGDRPDPDRTAARGPSHATETKPAPGEGASLLGRLASVVGLTATPSVQRAELPPGPVEGDVFIVDIDGRNLQRLTAGGGFRSPVFRDDSNVLLAMRGDSLVEIDLSIEGARELRSLPSVEKLVGLHPAQSTGLIYLASTGEQRAIGIIDIATRRHEVLPGSISRLMLQQILGEDRDYGDVRLHVRTHSDPLQEWTEISVQQGQAPERRLTRRTLDGSSRQPALSPDGIWVAFIAVAADE